MCTNYIYNWFLQIRKLLPLELISPSFFSPFVEIVTAPSFFRPHDWLLKVRILLQIFGSQSCCDYLYWILLSPPFPSIRTIQFLILGLYLNNIWILKLLTHVQISPSSWYMPFSKCNHISMQNTIFPEFLFYASPILYLSTSSLYIIQLIPCSYSDPVRCPNVHSLTRMGSTRYSGIIPSYEYAICGIWSRFRCAQ